MPKLSFKAMLFQKRNQAVVFRLQRGQAIAFSHGLLYRVKKSFIFLLQPAGALPV